VWTKQYSIEKKKPEASAETTEPRKEKGLPGFPHLDPHSSFSANVLPSDPEPLFAINDSTSSNSREF
jgi:hypothetical protein